MPYTNLKPMKKKHLTNLTLAGAATLSLLGSAFVFAVDEKEGDKLESLLTRDTSEIDRSKPLPSSYADVVDEVIPAIVSISTSMRSGDARSSHPFLDDPMLRRFFGDRIPDTRGRPIPGLGSGVVITADGYILTNNHVVERADEIKVKLTGSRKEYLAEIVGTDSASDVAVIKIDAKDLRVATLADSRKVRVGDMVLAIGSPLEYEATVTSGIVSAVGRSNYRVLPGGAGFEDFIQTDASINPGNSGGALLDAAGRVIGINTAIASRTGGNIGIGFAIPVNMAVNVAEALMTEGEVSRGYLGVELDDVGDNLGRFLGRSDRSGALVNKVMPGSPADKAGFQPLDIVTKFEGEEVTDMSRLRLRVGAQRPDSRVTFTVLRNGQEVEIEAVLAKLDETLLAGGESPRSRPPVEKSFLEGVEIANLTDSVREALELDGSIEGVAVVKVDPSSDAAAEGLSEGLVITSVNRKPVTSVREATEARDAVEGDILLLHVSNGQRSRFLAIELN
ncbi:DegQ family serine endoprotease [soil metagenome]